MHINVIISLNSSRIEKYSGKSCRENKTHILCTIIFHKTRAFSVTFIKTHYTKFNENKTKGSVTYRRKEARKCSTSKTQDVLQYLQLTNQIPRTRKT